MSTDAKDLLGALAEQVLRARAIRRSEDKAALTERAETPDAPPQTDTLWPKNPDTQGD